MSNAAAEPAATPPATTTTTTASAAASYALVGSYETVQVLSPTTMNDVVYCTIQTQPSGAIVSKTVQTRLFKRGESGLNLTNFAQAVEQIMADPRVIAAVGDQKIEPSSLLADYVVFTVEYIDPVRAPNGATALAYVLVGQLDFSDALIGQTLLAGVRAIIDGVYANLKAAAGG